MITVSVSKVKSAFSEYLNRAAYGQEPVIILSRGKPKAAMISVDALRRFEELEDAQAAREALAEYKAGETVAYEDFRAELVADGLLDE
jgi:prevent-host-death family protein